MKKIIMCLCFLFSLLAKGQQMGFRSAYTFTNSKYHLGFTGISFNTEPYYAGFSFYSGVHWGGRSGHLVAIPEVGADLYVLLGGLGLSINTHAIEPHAGVSLFNRGQLYMGYSIPLRRDPVFKGFTLTVVFNIFRNR